MRTIHVLCGEAILIGVVFLFYRTRLREERCTGCAACESSCPTGTLESKDEGKLRTFTYSPYQCVCCGACIHACPEEAAELRHAISIRNFFRVIPKDKIRSVELAVCKGCGALFAPEPLLDRVAKTIVDDYGGYCSTCKKTKLAANFYKLAPWPKKLQDKSKKDNVSTSTGMD
jgi:ferredoxin